jgi:peptide/nickel transport system substrate-binding protein
MDELLAKQRAITDRGEREKVLQQIAHYAADRALEMPLYNLNAIFGINKRVKNFTPVPDSRLKFTDVTVE